jgi:hypothetical protein
MLSEMELILNEINNYDYHKEFKFLHDRKFRFDYVFLLSESLIKGIAIEFEGGVWSKGRHIRPLGFIKDCEKYNLAMLNGYLVLRFTSECLKDANRVKATIENTLINYSNGTNKDMVKVIIPNRVVAGTKKLLGKIKQSKQLAFF